MTLGVARDMALIILIVPALICALVPGAVLFGAWWVTRRARRAVPPGIRRTRAGLGRVRDALDGATRAFTKPIFYGETQSARLRALWHAWREPYREK